MRMVRHALLIVTLVGAHTACSPSSDADDKSSQDGGNAGDGDGQQGDGDQPSPAERTECMQAVSAFCALSCECADEGSGCVTRNGTPIGSYLTLGWSDAADCEAAYVEDWCGGGTQAPESIAECKLAVDALACSDGGATRPAACDPAPTVSEDACTTDAECPDSHCAKAQSAIGGNPFDQEPMTSGRCATECRMAGEKTIVCGSACSPGGGSYCLLGWGCVNAECQCVIDPARPDLSAERCDRKDNDCNGVVDDQPAADDSCANFGDGYVCIEGICQPPPG
jgi:hypothetical protein